MTQTVCPVCKEPIDLPAAHFACAARPLGCPIPERIGPYPILREIGSGGMGIVYAGQQHCPAREVAVKVIKDGIFADDGLRAKFIEEREIAGSFEHPNIVRVYDAGEDADGELYYVMELAQRGTLRDFLRSESLSIRDAVRLMVEVALAIDHAHQRGVLHRDLKPDNILISADSRPRVTDFGVARRLEPLVAGASAPCESTLVGSYPYMAPEQAGYRKGSQPTAATNPSPAADLYSLGAIMYELVRGTPPYPVHTRDQLLSAFDHGPPQALHGTTPGVDYDLEAVIMKALDHAPAQRYPSAAAFAEDLRRTLGRRVPTAKPRSFRGRFTSTLSHHAAWFGILIAALTISTATLMTLKQREQTHLTQQTTRTAGVIGLIFAHAATITRQLAIDPMSITTLARAQDATTRDEAWLERIARGNKLINSAFLLAMNGSPVAHHPPESEGYYHMRFEGRAYFPGATVWKAPGPDLSAFVSPLFRSRARDGLIKLAFSAPVWNGGRQLGVAVVTVALEKLTQQIEPTLTLIAPCEQELMGTQPTQDPRVRVDRDAAGRFTFRLERNATRQVIKADVARTKYQVVAELQHLPTADRLLLGVIALLCLCALALVLSRRGRTEFNA